MLGDNENIFALSTLKIQNAEGKLDQNKDTHVYNIHGKVAKALPKSMREWIHPNPNYRPCKRRTKGGRGVAGGERIHRQLLHRSICMADINGCRCEKVLKRKTCSVRENSHTHKAIQQAELYRNDHQQIPLLAETIIGSEQWKVATRIDALDVNIGIGGGLVLVEWKTGYNSRSFRRSRGNYKHPMETVVCCEANDHQWQLFGQYMLLTREHKINNIKKACVVYLVMGGKKTYHVELAASWWWNKTIEQQNEIWHTYTKHRLSLLSRG